MSDRTRNITVGLTILIALVICMYGIFLLGKGPTFGKIHQYAVILTTPDANGVTAGAKVYLAGILVGDVESTWVSPNPTTGAMEGHVKLRINDNVDIPANSTATIIRSATGGNPTVDLASPAAAGPVKPLAKDGNGQLVVTTANSSPFAGIIPQDTIDKLNAAIANLNAQLVFVSPEDVDKYPIGDPRRPHPNATTAIARLNRTLKSAQDVFDSVQAVVGNAEFQEHFRDAVANIDAASAQIKTTLAKLQTLVDNANGAIGSFNTAAGSINGAATRASAAISSAQTDVDHVTAQLVETLASIQKDLHGITTGNGTAGKLINDPHLYNELTDLATSLKNTSDELEFLLKKWEAEGVNLHLGSK